MIIIREAYIRCYPTSHDHISWSLMHTFFRVLPFPFTLLSFFPGDSGHRQRARPDESRQPQRERPVVLRTSAAH
jgi:hypothetical protein